MFDHDKQQSSSTSSADATVAKPGKRTSLEQGDRQTSATSSAIPTPGRTSLVESTGAGGATAASSQFESFRAQGMSNVLGAVVEQNQSSKATVSPKAMMGVVDWHAATLYRKAVAAGQADGKDPAVQAALARAGSGEPLNAAVRAKMEGQFNASFGNVRVHTDGVAVAATRAVAARAFTVGEDIFFSPGSYAPESADGQKLLAHELAHVIQHQQGRTGEGGVSMPGDSLEAEADAMADKAMGAAPAGGAAPAAAPKAAASGAIMRKPEDQKPAGKDAKDTKGGKDKAQDEKGSKAKANAAAGKFGGGAGKQGPIVPPKAKDTPATAKPKTTATAAPKLDGKNAPKKTKGGGDPKVDAPPVGADTRGQAAFQPRASEPAKLTDVPDVKAPAPVVIDTPKGKVDPTFDTLRGEIASISAIIKRSHDEILATSKQLQQAVAGQLDAYAAAIDQKVEAGTSRVTAAYDGVSTAITAAGTHANEEIGKREKSIPATIKAARDKKAAEITAVVKTTKDTTHKKVTEGPQAVAAKQTALTFADSIKTKHTELKAKIKADTSPGGAIAGKLNPKQYSAQVQVGGAAARAAGLQALAEDKRLGVITEVASQANKFIDTVLDEQEKRYRATSGIVITQVLDSADKDLDAAIKQHEPEQQKHLDEAAALATKTLQKQVDAQRTGIATTQKQATTSLARDRKAAEDGAHKAGKQLSEDVKSGSKEIQNKLAKKAAQDAGSYGKLTQQLHQLGQSKKLDPATKAKLDTLKAQLDSGHAEHTRMLNELATTSVAELKSGKEQQYEQAIHGYETAAAKTKTDLVGTMTTATTSLGTSFDTIGTSFDATVTSETKKLAIDLDFYAQETPKVPETYGASLDLQLKNVMEGLGKTADKMLEPMKLQEKLDEKSIPEIRKVMKTGPEDAQGLWDAMDGIGTDENKIYGILRKASPGEIIFIEGCYNDAYSKRGTSEYPSPLRADLDDELSGTEWDIAFAYLRHEREKALTLELDNSTHWYNDEEGRIEDVLRAASDDEMKNIIKSDSGKKSIDDVKSHLGDCDLDVVNALTNVDIPITERKVQADAVRIYDAMYGGITGIGTDEALIKQKLEACKSKEEREALHAAYDKYIRAKDPMQVAILEADSKGKGIDLMDASFDDEMSGGEWTYVRTLSETKLDDKEHDQTVKMAKLVDGAQGAGTDEDRMYEALEDEEYAKKYADEKDPKKKAILAKAHEDELNARLQHIATNGMMTSGFKNGDGVADSVAGIIKGEMGSSSITFEELINRVWMDDKEKRGDKAGKPVDNVAAYQSAARMEQLNLEQMVAQRTLQAGKAEPELLIAYACWGVVGTDEATLKKGLKKGGELLSKGELDTLRTAFKHAWGVDLMDGGNEIEKQDFKEPSGVVPGEVSGKDWLEIRISLMGKPSNPAEIAYVDNVRHRFVMSGDGSPSPWSHAREDMDVNHKNVQAKAAEHIGDTDLKAYDAKELTKEEKEANAKLTTADGIKSAASLEDNRLETLAGYAEKSEMAFLEAKEAMTNAVITVIELIGAALITAASMGASSPMLVMFIGNLILSGMTIIMRKEALGDAYGSEDIGIDVVKGIVMAAIQAGSEAKFIGQFAGKAGKIAGKAWEAFAGGAEKAGMKALEGEGLAMAEKGIAKLEGQIAGKTVTKETENVATKEMEKAGTKEVTDTVEKAGAKQATGQAVKKTTAEHVEAAVTAGTKNAIVTGATTTAEFLMDEKNYDLKFWDALFDNPNSLGRQLLNKIPSAFAQGAVQDYISNISGAVSPTNVGKIRSGTEAVFRQMLAEFGGNAAGFMVSLDNYQDASAFWIEFLKSSARSVASGGFNGIGGHAMRAKALAREFVNAHKENANIEEAMHKLREAATYMKPDEMSNLANHVAAMDPTHIDQLPEEFKKYLKDPTKKPASNTETCGKKPAANDEEAAANADKDAAKKKADAKTAADEEAAKLAAKHKADEEAAAAKKKPEVVDEPKNPKTREDDEHQIKKPDEESLEEAADRRNKPVKPKSGSDEAWASPKNRQGIPDEVPLTRQELRDIVTAKYGKTLEKYLKGVHTENPELVSLMKKMEAEPVGFAKTEEGGKRLEEYMAEHERITKASGDTESGTELRSLYNMVEKEDMREVWAPKLKDLPLEQQAKLLSMYREELKLFVREMMPDKNSSEILMLRDRGLYGDRRGGRFDEFVEKGLNGKDQKGPKVDLENATQEQKDAAYKKVIASSMRSNEDFNLKTTGTKDGIDPEVGKKLRADANDVTAELPKVKAANADAIADEKAGGTKKPTTDEKTPAKTEETPAKTEEPPVKVANDNKHDATDEQLAQGHPGVEVHSHFIGNVPDENIKAAVGKSVGKVPNQVSEWEPLLREITKLKDNAEIAHKREGEDGKGKIKTRGAGGDAVELAQKAVKEIAELKRDIKRLEKGEGKFKELEGEARKAKILELQGTIETKARTAVESALKATDETDFNSSYAIRDELIKKHYGHEDRDAVLGTKSGGLTGEALGDADTVARLREHFKGRKTVLDRIDEAEEIQKGAKKGLTDKEKADLARLKKSIEDQFAYDQYTKETISRLADDNIKYTEQSNSGKKLDERFDKDQLAVLKKQLIDAQQKIIDTSPDEATRAAAQKKKAQLENLQIAHLAMVNTSFFGTRDKLGNEGEFQTFDRESEAGKKAWEKELDRVVTQAKTRDDTAGVDIAGMEHFRFDEIGQARMEEMVRALAKAAQDADHPIVVRPHVGEGAVDTKAGESANTTKDRYKAEGGKELSHYDRGRSNVDTMLEVFQKIADENGGRLPPNLIVRFGHVTHASPEAVVLMAKLGIIAEVNLTSNVKTGAVDQNPNNLGGKGQPKPELPERLEDHSLPTMIFAGAPVILSTDAHEVMGTDLPTEYAKAKAQIEKVRNNEQAIRVTVEQAEARGWPTHEGPPPHGTVFYYQLNDTEKGRFDGAYDKLYKDANKYYENRPKQEGGRKIDPGDDGSQTPKTPPPGTVVEPVPPGTQKPVEPKSQVAEQNDHLRKLKDDLKSNDEAVKTRAREELDRLQTDPNWHDALKLNELFGIGVKHKEKQGTEEERKADSESLSKNIPEVMAEVAQKKVGKDPVLQGKRDQFERAVAMEILNNGKIREQVDTELKRLCDIALDYITKTRATEAEQAKTISDMHTDASKGYGGGLRTKEMKDQNAAGDYSASQAKMMEVLKSGNIRERMLALQEFANIIGKDALTADGQAKILAAGETSGDKTKYSAEDAAKLVKRALEFQEVTATNKQTPANLFKPTMEEAEATGKHSEYAAAKASRDEAGHEMDTKLPPLLQEKINAYLGKTLAATPGALSAAGEDNPLARTTITVREAIRQGLQLSEREIAAAGGLDAELNWVVGSKANMVNDNLPFIKDAKENSMPLKAGISGTTYRWMQISDMLGGDPKLARLAAIASLQGADAHSFHEIAVSARGFGVDYSVAEPYAHMGDIPGLQPADLERIAKSVGTSMDELNGPKPVTPAP